MSLAMDMMQVSDGVTSSHYEECCVSHLMSVHWLGAGVCTQLPTVHRAGSYARNQPLIHNTEVIFTVHEDFMTPACLHNLSWKSKYIGFIEYGQIKRQDVP